MRAFYTGSLGSQSLGRKQGAREREKLYTVGVELGGRGREVGGPGMRLEREVVITWRPLCTQALMLK